MCTVSVPDSGSVTPPEDSLVTVSGDGVCRQPKWQAIETSHYVNICMTWNRSENVTARLSHSGGARFGTKKYHFRQVGYTTLLSSPGTTIISYWHSPFSSILAIADAHD